MQMRREIPEEVKNQMIDGKKRVVTVEMPEKQKKAIEKKQEDKKKIAQKFYQIARNVAKAQRVLSELDKQMEDIDQSISDRIKEAYKKLRLNKQNDRQWRYDGRNSFIGVYNPPPKKKEEKKEGEK